MKRTLLATLLVIFLICCSKQSEQENYQNVGDIAFDSSIDDKNFKICNEKIIKQYYVRGNSTDTPAMYKGEKSALARQFLERYKHPISEEDNGYITIRFIVNCEGKSGRFRFEEMSFNYQHKSFSPTIRQQLLQITKQLDGWLPIRNKEQVYDFYQYLTFKIEKGQLMNILP